MMLLRILLMAWLQKEEEFFETQKKPPCQVSVPTGFLFFNGYFCSNVIFAERLSARQLILRRISEIVCTYVCMYVCIRHA